MTKRKQLVEMRKSARQQTKVNLRNGTADQVEDLKGFADRLRKEGKPHKVVVTAVARKLVVIVNALCKSR